MKETLTLERAVQQYAELPPERRADVVWKNDTYNDTRASN